MKILLEDEELEELLGIEFRNTYSGHVAEYRLVAKAQLKKVANFIETLPTDGWDKWHYYNQDLAEKIREEID